MRIAIVGAGISGNLVARLLAVKHDITLFEASDYAGGHTNTVEVATSAGSVEVDTGFMVFNRRTYPNFCRMLDILGVQSQASDMSFSVHDELSGLEYNGSSLNGLFAQRRNLVRPHFYRLLRDLLRFHETGVSYATGTRRDDGLTLGQFLAQNRLGKDFRELYLVPMLAAIWSAAPASVENLPARFILGFMHNHGLMQLRNRPQWRTIVGGARQYVDRLLSPIVDRVRLKTPVQRIERSHIGVTVVTASGQCEEFDHVVLATHADQSLRMLDNPTSTEKQVLGSIPYQYNLAVLHSDPSPMPVSRRAWASWNYRIPKNQHGATEAASVTYDLNRLQGLPTDTPLFVSLNPKGPIARELVHQQIDYRHPCYSLESAKAQLRWNEVNGHDRTWYCGAYWGYGFHEDGVNSALRVAAEFGLALEDLQQEMSRRHPSDSRVDMAMSD